MQRYDLESVSCNRVKSVICRIGKYLFLGIVVLFDCFIRLCQQRNGHMDT